MGAVSWAPPARRGVYRRARRRKPHFTGTSRYHVTLSAQPRNVFAVARGLLAHRLGVVAAGVQRRAMTSRSPKLFILGGKLFRVGPVGKASSIWVNNRGSELLAGIQRSGAGPR